VIPQARHGLRLANEPLLDRVRLHQVRVKHLDRDDLAERGVDPLEHDAHAASPSCFSMW